MPAEVDKISDVVSKFIEGRETVFDLTESLSDDDGKPTMLQVGYRQMPPLPITKVKAPADARDHVFHDLQSFAAYLKRECEDDASVVLADVDRREMKAVLDEDNEQDREIVSYLAKTHPLFAPWEKLIGKSIPVLEFALHVMQYRNAVTDPDGRQLALTFSQIKASKRVTKHVGVGPKSLNGVVVEMTIGSEKKEVDVELPESVTIDVPIFLGLDPIEITLDLLVTEVNDSLVVFVTAPDLEAARVEAFMQMVNQLGKWLSDESFELPNVVGLGTVKHRVFRTLDMTK